MTAEGDTLGHLLTTFEQYRSEMRVDQQAALKGGNNEGSVFFRGELSGIGYAIDAIEKELGL